MGAPISGTLENGLRMLDVPQIDTELVYTIYRGDYIVFDFSDEGSHAFWVPDLSIDQPMPRPASEKPYVKMSKSGDFPFSLGSNKGIFHVIELVDAQYRELSAVDAFEMINNVQPLIIDVRTPSEYSAGHIPGANLLPVQVFAENIGKLEQYKDENILIYCASGNRSTVAAKMLLDSGFTKIHNLRQGIGGWQRHNLPME
jgi:rhodanese-related sulfurtransferase